MARGLPTKGCVISMSRPQLQGLGLEGTAITEAAIPHLAKLTQLKRLGLSGSAVSDAGVAKLQQAPPNCKITRSARPPPVLDAVSKQRGDANRGSGASLMAKRKSRSQAAKGGMFAR